MAENKTIEVTVVIDFRSKAQPIEKTFTILEKSTVFDALSAAVPVVTSRKFGMDPVSYTHLTLPTIYSV